MNGDSIMQTWTCRETGCDSKADGIGTPLGLICLGWWIEKKSDGDYIVLCPEHHPKGITGAEDDLEWVRIVIERAMEREEPANG
jgi:hypothetical protein